jgi:hypothetical protein
MKQPKPKDFGRQKCWGVIPYQLQSPAALVSGHAGPVENVCLPATALTDPTHFLNFLPSAARLGFCLFLDTKERTVQRDVC